MAPRWGVRVYVNGSTIDDSVENDNVPWNEKCGNIRISGGYGSWARNSQPSSADVDFLVRGDKLAEIREVGIEVTGPKGGSAQNGWYVDPTDATRVLRPVFHGFQVQSWSQIGTGIGRVDFADTMSAIGAHRARTAASPNSGIRQLLNDIKAVWDTASFTVDGEDQFPLGTDYYNLDRPAQKDQPNGAWIRTALTGSGINMACDWVGGTFESTPVEVLWRPDHFVDWSAVNTSRQINHNEFFPWALIHRDVGTQWNDFVARVNITGDAAGGTRRYGWARLGSSTYRRRLGNRDLNLSSWIDNGADLQLAAARIMGHIGEPRYLMLKEVTWPMEFYADSYLAHPGGLTTNQVYEKVCQIAGVLPGDEVWRRQPFNDGAPANAYATWPATAPVGSDRYEELEEAWTHTVSNNGTTGGSGIQHIIRTVTREYDPVGGWMLSLGLQIKDRVSIDSADKGNGTE